MRKPVLDRFVKGVLKLASATVVAQGISFLVLPILSRIFTPEDFGVYSLYLNTVSILLIFATLNYDVAISSPKEDRASLGLFFLSVSNVFTTSLAIGVVLHYFGRPVLEFFAVGDLYGYHYFIPVGLFLYGVFNSLHYFVIRKHKYGLAAQASVAQSVSQAIAQVGFGKSNVPSLSAGGLIVGDLANRAMGIIVLFATHAKEILGGVRDAVRIDHLSDLVYRYRQFPFFGLPSDLLITVGVAMPPILIGYFWGLETLGVYMIATKIAQVPMTLLGRSIAKVYLSEAMAAKNQGKEVLQKLFFGTAKKLALLAVFIVPAFLSLFMLVASPLLGPEWSGSGVFAVYLIPHMVMRLIASPISQTAAVVEKQNVEVVISGFRVVVILTAFLVLGSLEVEFERALLIYSLISAAVYGVFFWFYRKMVM